MTSKRLQQADAANRERLIAKIQRNDALFENANFRDFLADVANRALYFRPLTGLPDEALHATLALRDIVNGLVVNSSRGADWLREYAAASAVKPPTEKENG